MTNLHWPQYAYLGLTFVGLGIHLAKHGEPKEGVYNVVTGVIASGLLLWILYCGGVFG